MNIIAIDCGASFIKWALFENNKILKSDQITSPLVTNKANIFIPHKIEKTIEIIRKSIDSLLDEIDEAVLVIDNEMHGFVLAQPDGTPVVDYISWQNEFAETDTVFQSLCDTFGDEVTREIIKNSGMPLRSGLPSSNLWWLSHNGYIDDSRNLFFYTLGDYIIKRLTGREPLCHPTNAAASGLFNLETGYWNSNYISELIGKRLISFPDIGISTIEFYYKGKLLHVLPAIGDQQAALLGSDFLNEHTLSINMGTGAQVSRLIKEYSVNGNYQIRPYFKGLYLKTIPHIPSGRALNVFLNFLKDTYKKIVTDVDDALIWNIMSDCVSEKNINTNSICCDLSFFENASTNHKTGSIYNISEDNLNLSNLINSIFRQMVDNIVCASKTINEGLQKFDSIIFSGGMFKRWDILISEIVSNLDKDVMVTIADKDTLYGCMKYSNMYYDG